MDGKKFIVQSFWIKTEQADGSGKAGRIHCFNMPVFLGSPGNARWEEECDDSLTGSGFYFC
jgi:hypothetical protein